MDASCPFCCGDPYEYVDIGVGYEAVAIVCCDLAIDAYHGNKKLRRINWLLLGDRRQVARGKRLLKKFEERNGDE